MKAKGIVAKRIGPTARGMRIRNSIVLLTALLWMIVSIFPLTIKF